MAATWQHGLAILIGALFVVANIGFYKLSAVGGQASILAPATGLYVLVPVSLGMIVLHEPLSLRKAAGIALAVVAILLLSVSGKDKAEDGGAGNASAGEVRAQDGAGDSTDQVASQCTTPQTRGPRGE